MAEDTEGSEEEAAPAVELGEGSSVEGAPIARVASRLTWPIEKSEVDRKEGDTVVRTSDGPRPLSEILDDVEDTYFARRQDFVGGVRDVVDTAPVPTE